MATRKPQTKSFVLTDVEQGIWLDKFTLNPAKLKVAGRRKEKWSIVKRTLHGGLADGVDLVEVNNGPFTFSVLPTRGMGVWRGSYRGLPVGWRAPVRGPVHPKFVNLADRGSLGWLQGFDEMIARCGLDSNGAPCVDSVIDNNGNPRQTPLPLHGRIANQPACRVSVELVPGDPPEIAVCGVVEESMLFAPSLRLTTRISTRLGENAFTIADEVTNIRGIDAELQMLYHCNFGQPFLEAAARFVAPSLTIAPRDARATEDADYAAYLGPTPGYVEQVFYHELATDADGWTAAALVNAGGPGRGTGRLAENRGTGRFADKAVVVRFNRNELPCFAQWKNTIPVGDGYVTGLEPGTNFPNAKPFERANGRVIKLPPGGTWRATLRVEVLDSAEAVAGLQREIAALGAGKPRVVHAKPLPAWSPAT